MLQLLLLNGLPALTEQAQLISAVLGSVSPQVDSTAWPSTSRCWSRNSTRSNSSTTRRNSRNVITSRNGQGIVQCCSPTFWWDAQLLLYLSSKNRPNILLLASLGLNFVFHIETLPYDTMRQNHVLSSISIVQISFNLNEMRTCLNKDREGVACGRSQLWWRSWDSIFGSNSLMLVKGW